MFDPGYNAGYQPRKPFREEKPYIPIIRKREIEIFNLYMLHAGRGQISEVSFSINEELVYVNYIHKIQKTVFMDDGLLYYKKKALLIGSIVNGISYNDYTTEINNYFSSKESATYFGCKEDGECAKLIYNREKTIANYFKLRKPHY